MKLTLVNKEIKKIKIACLHTNLDSNFHTLISSVRRSRMKIRHWSHGWVTAPSHQQRGSYNKADNSQRKGQRAAVALISVQQPPKIIFFSVCVSCSLHDKKYVPLGKINRKYEAQQEISFKLSGKC